jgi:hypothetical protein
MVKSEKSKMAKGIVILFIAGCHAGFYLMADYGLWWVLKMMKTQLMQKTNKAGRLLEIKRTCSSLFQKK